MKLLVTLERDVREPHGHQYSRPAHRPKRREGGGPAGLPEDDDDARDDVALVLDTEIDESKLDLFTDDALPRRSKDLRLTGR